MLQYFRRFCTSLFVTRGDQHSDYETSNTPFSWLSQHPFIHPYNSHLLCPEQQSLLIPWWTRQRVSLIPMSFIIAGLGHLQTSSVWLGVWHHLRLGCQLVLYVVSSTPWRISLIPHDNLATKQKKQVNCDHNDDTEEGRDDETGVCIFLFFSLTKSSANIPAISCHPTGHLQSQAMTWFWTPRRLERAYVWLPRSEVLYSYNFTSAADSTRSDCWYSFIEWTPSTGLQRCWKWWGAGGFNRSHERSRHYSGFPSCLWC